MANENEAIDSEQQASENTYLRGYWAAIFNFALWLNAPLLRLFQEIFYPEDEYRYTHGITENVAEFSLKNILAAIVVSLILSPLAAISLVLTAAAIPVSILPLAASWLDYAAADWRKNFSDALGYGFILAPLGLGIAIPVQAVRENIDNIFLATLVASPVLAITAPIALAVSTVGAVVSAIAFGWSLIKTIPTLAVSVGKLIKNTITGENNDDEAPKAKPAERPKDVIISRNDHASPASRPAPNMKKTSENNARSVPAVKKTPENTVRGAATKPPINRAYPYRALHIHGQHRSGWVSPQAAAQWDESYVDKRNKLKK